MADAEEPLEVLPTRRRYWPRKKRWQFLLVLLFLLVLVSTLTWRSREDIADNLIESQLEQLGIDASYEIESIAPTRQILRNFIVGNPDRPDLFIERVELVPRVGLFGASIGTLRVLRPRLRAHYHDGKLDLGALNPLLEMEPSGPAQLPSWNLTIVDGRARIFSDYGVIGIDAQGSGTLDDGFSGTFAAVSPDLTLPGCNSAKVVLSGRMAVSGEQPGFSGPLQISSLGCGGGEFAVGEARIDIELTADRDLAGLGAELQIKTDGLKSTLVQSGLVTGTVDLDWRDGLANTKYRLAAEQIHASSFEMRGLEARGAARYRARDDRLEVDAGIDGRDVALVSGAKEAVTDLGRAAAGTLLEPLVDRFAQGIETGLAGSRLNAELTLRRDQRGTSVVVPAARLRDANTTDLLAISQLQYRTQGDEPIKLSGNFATYGDQLPQLRGRLEQASSGLPSLQLEMTPYRQGESSLAIPQLKLTQGKNGALSVVGRAIASGDIPGGKVAGLELPFDGRWSTAGGLALWQGCTGVSFARLELSGLELQRNSLTFCPDDAFAVVRADGSGLAFAAASENVVLNGRMGEAPVSIEAAQLSADSLGMDISGATIDLGAGEELSEFELGSFDLAFEGVAQGSLSDAVVKLAAVPLDVVSGKGNWRYEDGALYLDGADFELRDRNAAGAEPRFYPLVARDAVLQFESGEISAAAALRNPDSDLVITEVDIRHNLESGKGWAVLTTPSLQFDDNLQPDQLTILADGVVALADGRITGGGRIDWNPDGVTSSGEFSSDDFDFAAAFGPVQGVSGTISFSDLLSLTTDGTQSLKIGSINPGVEVFDGVLDFALRDGTLVSIKGGRWPFFGGTMVLRPTELNLAVGEQRNYVIEITGADAAQFVTAMEMGNLSVTGTFDGAVPLVFDEMGNGEIKNGLLISRPPGGNVSYVGELTYQDAGAIANFAFNSLRSLDFSQMMVEMNGPLSGEIITRLLFDGISQGEGADSNFVTRQIAKLPIRFNVNIRASFYQLLTDLRSMYDPAFIRDPRSLGLLRTEDGRLVRPQPPEQPAIRPEDIAPDESSIQPDESEILP